MNRGRSVIYLNTFRETVNEERVFIDKDQSISGNKCIDRFSEFFPDFCFGWWYTGFGMLGRSKLCYCQLKNRSNTSSCGMKREREKQHFK